MQLRTMWKMLIRLPLDHAEALEDYLAALEVLGSPLKVEVGLRRDLAVEGHLHLLAGAATVTEEEVHHPPSVL